MLAPPALFARWRLYATIRVNRLSTASLIRAREPCRGVQVDGAAKGGVMPKLWWALSYSSGPLLASSLVVHSLPWGKDTRPEALLMTYEAWYGAILCMYGVQGEVFDRGCWLHAKETHACHYCADVGTCLRYLLYMRKLIAYLFTILFSSAFSTSSQMLCGLSCAANILLGFHPTVILRQF